MSLDWCAKWFLKEQISLSERVILQSRNKLSITEKVSKEEVATILEYYAKFCNPFLFLGKCAMTANDVVQYLATS